MSRHTGGPVDGALSTDPASWGAVPGDGKRRRGLQPDRWIRAMAEDPAIRMIEPFVPELVRAVSDDGTTGALSFGLSSGGYDMRLADELLIFEWRQYGIIDPKAWDPAVAVRKTGRTFVIPPRCFALGRSVELFRIPADVLGLVTAKSTYARCGLGVPPTTMEPTWRGHLVLELINHTPLPIRVYAGEGIAQVLFFVLSDTPDVTYEQRGGIYQDQRGITPARVR